MCSRIEVQHWPFSVLPVFFQPTIKEMGSVDYQLFEKKNKWKTVNILDWLRRGRCSLVNSVLCAVYCIYRVLKERVYSYFWRLKRRVKLQAWSGLDREAVWPVLSNSPWFLGGGVGGGEPGGDISPAGLIHSRVEWFWRKHSPWCA